MGFFQNLTIKTKQFKDDMIKKWTKSLINSSAVIKTIEELNTFIKKSETTTFTWEDGATKDFKHMVIVIFADKKSDFFESALVQYPILKTKCFSQNIELKLCNMDIKALKDYNISALPSLVVFETEEILEILEWEEDIKKVVTKMNLNIIENIQNIK